MIHHDWKVDIGLLYCNQPSVTVSYASISLQGLDGRSLMYTLYRSGRFGVEKESSLIMPNIYLHTLDRLSVFGLLLGKFRTVE